VAAPPPVLPAAIVDTTPPLVAPSTTEAAAEPVVDIRPTNAAAPSADGHDRQDAPESHVAAGPDAAFHAPPFRPPAIHPPGAPGFNGSNGAAHDGPIGGSCTAPQLRRFIKSRPYVPMHELRRRFGINGGDDEVTAVDLGSGRIFVGLPYREGTLLGELLRGGEIGYELSLDPRSPVVVGLYPMRPIARA
jgi:hypothetical protein